jgi:hypothetical protein
MQIKYKIKNNTGISENIKVTIFNLDGTVQETIELKNQLKNCWFNAIRDAFKGDVTDLEIKYLAWGSDATANNTSQTKLVAEFGRKQITGQDDGGTGELISTTYIAPNEAVGTTIEELGWFAGAIATAAADSGILVGRVLYHRVKTTLESLEIERTDQISEVV